MVHPVEIIDTAGTTNPARSVKLDILDLTCKVISTGTTTYVGGNAEYLYRSASRHSTIIRDLGWRPPRDYEYTHIVGSNPASDIVMRKNDRSCNTWVYYGLPSKFDSFWPYSRLSAYKTPFDRSSGWYRTNMKNWVRTQALAKLNRFDINLGATFGERAQTYKMVLGAIKDIIWFMRRVRAGDFPALRHKWMQMDPFSMYLEYRYGWKPLFNDIVGACGAIEALEDGSYKKLRVHVKAKKKVTFQERSSKPVSYATLDYAIGGFETAKCRYDFNLENPTYVTLASLGLGPQTIWELTTMSFVADWFINIGTFLEAWSMLPGWTSLGGTMTTFGKYQGFYRWLPGTWPVVRGTGGKYEAITFKRELEAAPLPTLAINPDVLMGKFSPTRIADAVALMMQHARKFPGMK